MEKINFEQFLAYFELIEMPVTLTEELYHTFDQHAKPIPALLIEAYIHTLDHGNIDEFTEYIPCFKIAGTKEFHALVYWKAGLLSHEYHLACYDLKGNIIDHAIISGIKSVNDMIVRSVATITPELIVNIATGASDRTDKVFDPTRSKMMHIEIMDTGHLTFEEGDDSPI